MCKALAIGKKEGRPLGRGRVTAAAGQPALGERSRQQKAGDGRTGRQRGRTGVNGTREVMERLTEISSATGTGRRKAWSAKRKVAGQCPFAGAPG